jgi:hypothetical protein
MRSLSAKFVDIKRKESIALSNIRKYMKKIAKRNENAMVAATKLTAKHI